MYLASLWEFLVLDFEVVVALKNKNASITKPMITMVWIDQKGCLGCAGLGRGDAGCSICFDISVGSIYAKYIRLIAET